ncbi:uncharacterized protein PG986_008472 [Apiospora aurea]|uniref:Uncharacterized protein n=1 Tax=Apiospora aurea TaxID=335848 RepID=A0ABR1QFH8_9PEZI
MRKAQERRMYSSLWRSPTNTIWLPPQTTPFTPPYKDGSTLSCEATLNCWSGLYECYPGYSDPYLVSAKSLDIDRPECFPSWYYDIGTHLSVAYPGTACISGWRSACATTFPDRGQTYSQVWCCPAGEFACTAAETYDATTIRMCVSTVLDPTGYIRNMPYRADLPGMSTVVISTSPGERPYKYWVSAFPLQVPAKTTSTVPITTEETTGSGSAAEGASASSAEDGTGHLSKGSLAGAISASILAVLIAAAMIYAATRRRRRGIQAPETAVVDRDQGVDPYYGGKPELDTADVTRAELSGGGSAMCSEMDGWSRPAEVPTTTTTGPGACM